MRAQAFRISVHSAMVTSGAFSTPPKTGPTCLQFPADTQVWALARRGAVRGAGARWCAWVEVVGRLLPGVSLERARGELNRLQRSIPAAHGPADVSPAVTVTQLARKGEGSSPGRGAWREWRWEPVL